MASNTQTTEFKRKLRKKRAGRKAKNARANHGTTPAFPTHSAAAVANAPAAELTAEQLEARQQG